MSSPSERRTGSICVFANGFHEHCPSEAGEFFLIGVVLPRRKKVRRVTVHYMSVDQVFILDTFDH